MKNKYLSDADFEKFQAYVAMAILHSGDTIPQDYLSYSIKSLFEELYDTKGETAVRAYAEEIGVNADNLYAEYKEAFSILAD